MKIEKIKYFNQIMLAFVGIFGLIVLTMIIIMQISELLRNKDGGYGRNTDGLISEEKIEMLNIENQRLQIISYQSPKLIDTVNVVYIIPISVSTLDKPETIPQPPELKSSLDLYSDFNVDYNRSERYYQGNYFHGLFANIIVYQPIENKTALLFNERIMLNRLQSYYFKDDILLIFFTAEKDTNNDGLINFNDDTNLCVYSLRTGKMRRISDGTNSITDYIFVENSKDLLIEFSLNQYNDVKFKSYKPRKIMKYEFVTEKLSEVVPAQIQQQMQNLVESKKDQ